TSLHKYLNAHPDIYMSDNKEPGYFVKEMSLSHGLNWYLALFKSGEGATYIGESSTHYTKLPTYTGVPKRLWEFAPTAKLVYLMRDPFDRLVSHYWHEVRKVEHGGEYRSLQRAVAENPEYLAFSYYAMQLRPYLELFGQQSIHIMTFEALMADPNSEVNKLFAWLKLAPLDVSDQTHEIHNQRPEKIIGVSGFGVLNKIR